MNTSTELREQIVFARYGRKAKVALDEYFSLNKLNKDSIDLLLIKLESSINTPISYPDYEIPEVLTKNRELLLPELQRLITKIRKRTNEDELKEEVYKLFVDKNWLIKYATQQWFLANSGLAIELIKVKPTLEDEFLSWLDKEFYIKPGVQVVHRHVISNSERESLKQIGIPTPDDHWSENYYVDAMRTIQELVKSNPNCAGILSDGSWTYNPDLYETAEDGKPYAAFTFLKNSKLVGHRFFLMTALPDNDQANQYNFAIRSERRKKFIEEGKLKIDVYCVFYPREELLKEKF